MLGKYILSGETLASDYYRSVVYRTAMPPWLLFCV